MTVIHLPYIVTLTRLASRDLDDDNLRFALKYIRDELSELLMPEYQKSYVNKKGRLQAIKGRGDADSRITWRYGQERASMTAVRIEIESSSELLPENIDDAHI